MTISTIAGGGFDSNVPVREAPMVQPTSVVFDPLGRVFYIVDEVNGASLLRFVNTSANPVTLAGTMILPKQINLIAGGGNSSTGNGDGGPATMAKLVTPIGLAFDSNNNLLIADGGDPYKVAGSVRRVEATGLYLPDY